MRPAPCHPERSVYARELCRSCYERDLLERNPDYRERQLANARAWAQLNKDRKAAMDRAYHADPRVKGAKSERTRRDALGKYGLSFGDEDALLAHQANVCAICGGPPGGRWFHLDHDHSDGTLRGLLCGKCNKGIGLLGDTREGIERALAYLCAPPAQEVFPGLRLQD